MTKKLCAVFLTAITLLSFTACVSSSSASVDEQSADAGENIENYLDKAEEYFSVKDATVAISGAASTDDLLKVYVDKAEAKKDLPEALVNGYVNSYKAYFTTESADEDALRANAESLIKTEMVVFIAAKMFGVNEISADDEKAKAQELANTYGFDESTLYTEGGSNYIVKSAIREERVSEKLQKLYSTLVDTSSAE